MTLIKIVFVVAIVQVLLLLLTSPSARSGGGVVDAAVVNGTWMSPVQSPGPRANHAMACLEDESSALRLFVLGGTAGGAPLLGLYAFDLDTNMWSKLFDDGGKFSDIVDVHLIALRDATTNMDQLLSFGGRNYYTNEPQQLVQVYDGQSWQSISATNPTDVSSRSASTFYSGLFQSVRGQIGTGIKGAYTYGGVDTHGWQPLVRALKFNRSQGIFSSMWQQPPINRVGTQGVDFPYPTFGSCCAGDPSRPASDNFAFCFGGTNERNDTNDVWRVEYWNTNANSSYTLVATTGPAPTPRRLASCAFVATNKFAVVGGFDSANGRPVADNDMYLLTFSSNKTGAWTRAANDPAVSVGSNGQMTTCYYSNGTFRTFLFGGVSVGPSYASTLFSFNNVSNRFEPQQIMQAIPTQSNRPSARGYHNTVRARGDLFSMNGVGDDQASLNDLWKYDVGTEKWSKLRPAATWTSRYGASASTSDSLVYMYGGLSTSTSSSSSSSSSSSASSSSSSSTSSSSSSSSTSSSSSAASSATTETVLAELVAVDLQDLTVKTTVDSSMDANAPQGRYYHQSVLLMNTLLILGGKDSTGNIRPDVCAFSVIDQKWARLQAPDSSANATKALGVYGHFALEFNATHALAGLGAAADGTRMNLYWVYGVNLEAGTFNVSALNISSAAADQRDYVRAFAGVVLAGRFLLVCGGMSTVDMILPPASALCYSVDLLGGPLWAVTSFAGLGSQWSLTGSTLTQVGQSVFMIFGQQGNNIALRNAYNPEVVRFAFSNSSMCAFGAFANSSQCVSCSPGLTNPDCAPAAKGFYVYDSAMGAVACPPGSYSNVTGASSSSFCLPCDFGTYQPLGGQSTCAPCPPGFVCVIGANSAIDASSSVGASIGAVPVATESHPSAYASPAVPVLPIIIIASVVGVCVLVAVVVLMLGELSRRRYKAFYLSDTAGRAEQGLERIYQLFAKGRFGMTKEDLVIALVQARADFFPAHCIDAEVAIRLFDYIDSGRSGYLTTLGDFELVICRAIELGYMEPFPSTDAAKTGRVMPSPPSGIAKMRLSTYDLFKDAHSYAKVGETNKFLKTSLGGIVSVVVSVLVVGLIGVVVLDFLLNIAIETKSAVPAAVVHSSFNDNIGTDVYANIEVRVTYWSLLRSGLGVSTLADACVNSAAASSLRQCVSTVSASPWGFVTRPPGTSSGSTGFAPMDVTDKSFNSRLNCEFSVTDMSCTVIWSCDNCRVSGTSANVSFLISPAVAARMVRTNVRTGTAIRFATQSNFGLVDLIGGSIALSSVTAFARPSSNNSLLTGFPASTFYFGLVKTYFEAQLYGSLVASADSNTFRDSGYHSRNVDVASGNAIAPALISKYFDAPVTVEFSVDTTPMLVQRVLVRTLMDLVTGLLGAVSGLMSLMLVVMKFLDQRGKNDNYDEDGRDRIRDINDERQKEDEELAPVEASGGKTAAAAAAASYIGATTKPPPKARSFMAPHENPAINPVNFERFLLLMESGLSVRQAEAIVASICNGAGIIGPGARPQWRAIPQPVRFVKLNENSMNEPTHGSVATTKHGVSAMDDDNTSNNSSDSSCDKKVNASAAATAASGGGGAGRHEPAGPSDDRLEADDYALDPSRNENFYFSDKAGLFWDPSSNLFFDPVVQRWWSNEEKKWLS